MPNEARRALPVIADPTLAVLLDLHEFFERVERNTGRRRKQDWHLPSFRVVTLGFDCKSSVPYREVCLCGSCCRPEINGERQRSDPKQPVSLTKVTPHC
jgi:hypothetical protein